MIPSSAWFSETNTNHAKTIIVLGEVSSSNLKECVENYSRGILLISRDSNQEDKVRISKLSPDTDKSIFKSKLTDFLLLDPIHPPEIKVSLSVREKDTQVFDDLLQLILKEIDTLLRARRTRNENGYLRQSRFFGNLNGYLNSRLPSTWHKLGQKKLAVVVGSGPSLDQSLKLIKDGLPNPIIIATDSSLTALKKEDIKPNFVISIDPEKRVENCTKKGFYPGIAILSSHSHPSWAIHWGSKIRYISGRVISEDWLAEKGVGKSKFSAANNAGLTAIAMANFISAEVILLLGMDLSGGGKGEIRYAENTGRSHIETNSVVMHRIPGNYSEKVSTPFLSDWEETSLACSKYSQDRTIINLNDRGALLQNTVVIHPDDFRDAKKIISENLNTFEESTDSILNDRQGINLRGKQQILHLLAAKCDEIWRAIDNSDNKTGQEEKLIEILSNRDTATLWGDFSFSVMPYLNKNHRNQSFEREIIQLRNLLWQLEDAILRSSEDEDFMKRFLTEKFC
ncbi:MAG: 6-hydroxymethylpterin diphosphokinase MptE-like protein [Verrucomicrobiota bacterium]|nr:6-hydroxymethylpterin diphosphokinase MptE-like protein [Verrucomicrobiota bacterium]